MYFLIMAINMLENYDTPLMKFSVCNVIQQMKKSALVYQDRVCKTGSPYCDGGMTVFKKKSGLISETPTCLLRLEIKISDICVGFGECDFIMRDTSP